MRTILFLCILLPVFNQLISQNTATENQASYQTERNIYYRSDSETDEYIRDRCVLDIYYPEDVEHYATIVWFHGGGLTAGNKFIPNAFKNQNLAVVAVNYRFYPKVKAPVYIEDAAAAVAWVFNNIANYGGDRNKIVVSGHSAGGYLTSMVGLDSTYLAPYGIHPNEIAALIPYSGHTITHFTVRKERGIEGNIPIVDNLAPLFHVRDDAPPIILITGDRELELLGRYEETAYFERMMQISGHKETALYELEGFNHGEMAIPAHQILLKYVKANIQK